MGIYFIDGKFVKREEVQISIDDRGYYFGDGVYEVVKVYDGELFTGKEHYERLIESAAKIKLNLPYTFEELMTISHQLIEKNELVNGHIYLQVTRGVAPRQHHFPAASVKAMLTAYTVEAGRPLSDMEKGVAVKTLDDIRWLRCDIKSLNLLGSVMAKEEAKEAGYHEAMLHRDGVVTEGSSTNMFAVKDGVVRTHPVSNLILNGITRRVVLAICEELSIPVDETAFTVDEAYTMDELFYTSTTAEVMPIIQLDDRQIADGQKGALTAKIQEAFSQKVAELSTVVK